MTVFATRTAVVNRLVALGIIRKVDRGVYTIVSEGFGNRYSRANIIARFAVNHPVEGYFLSSAVRDISATPSPAASRPLRTITRYGYRSQERNILEALRRLDVDADGRKRSYGLEYEIYSLTRSQESKLAYLLDTLPPHVTERDGSLSSSGVEIVFEPMSEKDLRSTVEALGNLVREEGIEMNGAGMHITVGLTGTDTYRQDLVIRMNRLALAVKSVALQERIREVFGRDFTGYARLPENLNDTNRYRAFNVRNESAWECRLVQWNANMDKLMDFFKIAEPLFDRPFEAADFMKLFELFGSNVSGE